MDLPSLTQSRHAPVHSQRRLRNVHIELLKDNVGPAGHALYPFTPPKLCPSPKDHNGPPTNWMPRPIAAAMANDPQKSKALSLGPTFFRDSSSASLRLTASKLL